MTKQTHIFATKNDLLSGLKILDSKFHLRYVLIETRESPDFRIFQSLSSFDLLGLNSSGSHIHCDTFLVLDAAAQLRPRKIIEKKSKVRSFTVDQRAHPDSIIFSPGGLYQHECLVCGHVGTSSAAADSITLYEEFTRALIKNFQKVQSYYVGPEAFQKYKEGLRLVTIDVRSSAQYDLKIPNAPGGN